MVGRIGKLPAMPKTYGLLQAALAQPTVTAAQIGDIVSADAAIASKVLQITNSAFFRLRKPMVRIKDAVTYLGFATVRNLVLSAEIFSQWQAPKGLSDVDPERMQMHADNVQAAAACKALAGGRASPDDAWLAGLLHDIGYWILIQECPKELANALQLARAEGLSLLECERRVTGATHAEIGAYLLGLWGLPYAIVEAVALHHTPTAVTTHGYDLRRRAGRFACHDRCGQRAMQILRQRSPIALRECRLSSPAWNAPFDWQTAADARGERPSANLMQQQYGKIMNREDLPSILCVDDEPRIVGQPGGAQCCAATTKCLAANGGNSALQLLKGTKARPRRQSSLDMRMPGMDGATLLKHVRQLYPETTRILLTGEPGRDAAIAAVNEGQIFRFLTKPCPPDQLRSAIEAGVNHHRLLIAEKVLLQETLIGCIKALVDILAITNPVASLAGPRRVKSLATELGGVGLSQGPASGNSRRRPCCRRSAISHCRSSWWKSSTTASA